jgi:8-oxo-dGTP diphosphatase
MKKRACVIILDKDKVLLMHRNRQKHEYYCVLGGTVEENESYEETAVRELKEEANLDVELGERFAEIQDEMCYAVYYLAKSYSGEIKLGGPEVLRNCEENFYELVWVKLSDLKELRLFPKEIKEMLISKSSII